VLRRRTRPAVRHARLAPRGSGTAGRAIRSQLSNDPAGFTLVELLIVVAIIGVLASVSMALYRSARVRAGEATALATLHAINQAQFAYAQLCGNQRYAPTLAALATPMPTSGQPFVSPDLGVDPLAKNGYQFTMAGTPVTEPIQTCTGITPLESYQVTAEPLRPGLSGNRFFATNTDRVVYEDAEKTFATDMPEKGAPSHGAEMK
jgi:prepilin-type N-terminal cleavage/methylation domain-containing protein